jgi:hypothetical protein
MLCRGFNRGSFFCLWAHLTFLQAAGHVTQTSYSSTVGIYTALALTSHSCRLMASSHKLPTLQQWASPLLLGSSHILAGWWPSHINLLLFNNGCFSCFRLTSHSCRLMAISHKSPTLQQWMSPHFIAGWWPSHINLLLFNNGCFLCFRLTSHSCRLMAISHKSPTLQRWISPHIIAGWWPSNTNLLLFNSGFLLTLLQAGGHQTQTS